MTTKKFFSFFSKIVRKKFGRFTEKHYFCGVKIEQNIKTKKGELNVHLLFFVYLMLFTFFLIITKIVN